MSFEGRIMKTVIEQTRSRICAVAFGAACLIAAAGCGRSAPAPVKSRPSPPATQQSGSLLPPIDLPQPSQRLGTAVVVVVDTAGSMGQAVRDHAGAQRPKHEIARTALKRIIEVTDGWHKQHADAPLFLGIMSFAGLSSNVLPVGPFDAAKAEAAV